MASSMWPFWSSGEGTSSSSRDFLHLSRANIERICELIRHGEPLNPHQCSSMSSKLKATLENIEGLDLALSLDDIKVFPGSAALENFHRVSEKAKNLVENCCSVDWRHWCQASAFQIQNEEAFREILLETSLSYHTICELFGRIKKGVSFSDLRLSNTFDTSSDEEVREDHVALRYRLVGLVSTEHMSGSDIQSQQLGKYLLGRVDFALTRSIGEDFDVRSSSLSLDGEDVVGGWSEKSVRLGSNVIKTAWYDVPCARKEFEDALQEDEWLAEATILASLNHPNIVKFLYCNTYMTDHTGGHFIAMEHMEMSLCTYLRRIKGAKLPLFVALDIILQIGYGMCYLHDHGVAHRDLKTPNVVCSIHQHFLEVKVVDFGLAKVKLSQDKSNPVSRPKIGTTNYMAPEAFSSGRADWFKADVYSFSVMCSVILSGEEPFQNVKRRDLCEAVCSGSRPKLPHGTPDELASVIKKGWDADRTVRPSFRVICTRLESLRHRLLRIASLHSLGVHLEVKDRYDDLYIDNAIEKRSQTRQKIVSDEEEFFDGDRVEEQSVQAQHYEIAVGADCPQGLEISWNLSSTTPPQRVSTDTGTGEWVNTSPLNAPPPFSVGTSQAQVGVQAVGIRQSKPVRIQAAPTGGKVESHPAAPATYPSCYLDVNYFTESLSSIKLIQQLASGHLVQLHSFQCHFLSSKVSETRSFLEARAESLRDIPGSEDSRRTALQQLHFVVKRAEKLLRGCCCETEPSWLESAMTLAVIKEDVVDILLDCSWWTSIVGIAVVSNIQREMEFELVTCAEEDLQKLQRYFQSHSNELDEAAAKDKEQLLARVKGLQRSYGSGKFCDRAYLLAAHVRSRLESTDLVQSMADVELNVYEYVSMIGMGSFGCVMNVDWMGRSCALKILKFKSSREAEALSLFQHPHIVQFVRYWETPFDSERSNRTTPVGVAMGASPLRSVSKSDRTPVASHILMERLPNDLSAHMHTTPVQAMPLDVSIDVMLQVVKAMWHMNSKNVSHRDLKPSNVLVRPVSATDFPELASRGYVRVKLGDFGLVSTKAVSVAKASATKMVGTRMYGAPEVFWKDPLFPKDKSKFPRSADVWSWGIMFSEMLNGRPWSIPEDVFGSELQARILRGFRPELPRTCPEYLRFCVDNCLELRPQNRPTFADLWKLMRFAQVRSLGIIREDHDLFTFTTREGVPKRMHKQPPNKKPKNVPRPSPSERKPNSNFFRLLADRITYKRRDASI